MSPAITLAWVRYRIETIFKNLAVTYFRYKHPFLADEMEKEDGGDKISTNPK